MPAGSGKTKKPAPKKASPPKTSEKPTSSGAEIESILKGIPLKDFVEQLNEFLPELLGELGARVAKIKKR